MLTSKASGPAHPPDFGPSPLALLLRRTGPFLPASPVSRGGGLLVVLAVLVAAGDWLLWQVRAPALSAAVLVMLFGLVAVALEGQVWTQNRRSLLALIPLGLGILPLIEVANVLTLGLALLGCLASALFLTGVRASGLPFAILKEYGTALATLVRALTDGKAQGPSLLRAALNWIMPLGFGLVFVGLFASANPVLKDWILAIDLRDLRAQVGPRRVLFWLVMAALIWPSLALYRMARASQKIQHRRPMWFFNAPSVVNGLVLFNGIFAVQTLTDAAYLWGGLDLPEGMTYAEYAHGGAYPLVVTALLAGLFTLLAHRWCAERPLIRWLLVLWAVQNLALVGASIFRLDLYVDAYGLTILRFSAFVWMGLVAGGLLILLAQLIWKRSVTWMLNGAGALAAAVLYGVAFVNVPALVAQSQLDNMRGESPDWRYLCSLGEEAAVVLAETPCQMDVSPPKDWREWGYRNARIRGTLAATE